MAGAGDGRNDSIGVYLPLIDIVQYCDSVGVSLLLPSCNRVKELNLVFGPIDEALPRMVRLEGGIVQADCPGGSAN